MSWLSLGRFESVSILDEHQGIDGALEQKTCWAGSNSKTIEYIKIDYVIVFYTNSFNVLFSYSMQRNVHTLKQLCHWSEL